MPEIDRRPLTASRVEMGRVTRNVASRFMRVLTSRRRRDFMRHLREVRRRATRAPHRVDYFHQVDDAYSQLTAQALAPLLERYDIELRTHLVRPAGWPNIPEPELLAQLGRRDCAAVAPHYGLSFPAPAAASPAGAAPDASEVRAVERALAAVQAGDAATFGPLASELGALLWGGDPASLRARCEALATADDAAADSALDAGSALREKLGHYSGAMFHYAGEWYWGVDRLYHLERRLRGLGAARAGSAPAGDVRFARPEIAMRPVARADELTLEIFPSLRSPYTAISFDPTLELVKRTGVACVVRPVLPMVMRGVPATMTKGFYIMTDTVREAETLGVPFGKMVDPIGEPVRRAYSLWPWARKQGRGAALISRFLRAAWAEGIDTSSDAGLQRVVDGAGLSWEEAKAHLGDPAWEAELEENRLCMIEELGQWGVPSFRLSGPGSAAPFSVWGQDRLWLVAHEIQTRGAAGG